MKVQVGDRESLSKTARTIAMAVGQREAAEHRRDKAEAGRQAAQAEVKRLRAENNELWARIHTLEALTEMEQV